MEDKPNNIEGSKKSVITNIKPSIVTLEPNYQRIKQSNINGEPSLYKVVANPNTASAGGMYYATIPSLGPGICLVPNTLYLTAKFKSTNTKATFKNNLGRLLVKGLRIEFDENNEVYNNVEESTFTTYKDLWLSERDRKNRLHRGIMSENARKLMSKDDSAASDNAADNIVFSTYDGRIWIKLGKILNDYGLYPTVGNLKSVRYTITLPSANEIMVPQNGQTAGYSLEDIRYEFRVLRDPAMFSSSLDSYTTGRSLVYDDVSFFKRLEWDKTNTLHNIDIDTPRKKIKSVILLFRNKDATDSEEFVYPKIKNVRVTYGSTPNYVYTDGMSPSDMFREADDVFRNNVEYTLSEVDFFTNKYALVLDLRSVKDNEIFGSGVRVDGTSTGVKLAITKAVTTKDVLCYIYVIASSIVNISNSKFQYLDR